MTALSRLSKDSSIFLSEPAGAGAAALALDVGQERTNLTNNATYVSESPSARTAATCPREVAIVVNLTNTSSGVILEHGNIGGYGYRIRVNAGAIEVAEVGALRVSVTLPGTAASPRKFLIHWSQRPIGASVISDVYLFNYTTLEWSFGTATHAASAVSATDTLVIGAAFGGASTFSGGVSAFYVVRIGRRHVSGTEASEDFVAETVPPTFTGRRRSPLPTGASNIASEGQFAGPTFLHALAATREADSRTVTALVNVTPRNPYVESNAYAPVRYFRPAFDSPVYHLSTRYLWHAYASPKTNHARVRLHLRAYNAGGGGSIGRIYLRVYSVANLPVGGPGMPPPLVYYKTATLTIAAPTSADGAWQDLGIVRIAKEDSGLTYFCLGLSFNLDAGASLEEAATRLKINAVTIEPFFKDPGDGDIDEKGGL